MAERCGGGGSRSVGDVRLSQNRKGQVKISDRPCCLKLDYRLTENQHQAIVGAAAGGLIFVPNPN